MEWDISNIDSIIAFINSELQSGRPMASIEREEFCCTPRTIAKRLKRLHYKRVDNQYILWPVRQVVRQTVIKNEVAVMTTDDDVRQDSPDIEKLMGLVNRYDEIINLLDNRVNTNFDVPDGLSITLPSEMGKKDTRATVRVNSIVWDKFNSFCEINKAFSKKDLLSQALTDFMEKYI